ncbi:MAG TPA: polysaccharide deacetylase family protein, partial [Acidimicrobiales bacterium]|nr:polysaccharide deacetylase family protein [Acidimicrobiales bacterium]
MSPPVPVLMYHHVVGGDPGPGDPFTVGADELDEHLAALVAAGRRLRPVGALLDDPSPHDVYLTFDDAFTSFAELVVPLLDAHGAGATVFVPTAWMGSAADWAESGDAAGLHVLSASQVAALPPALVEVGGHGHRHTPLDLLDAATLADELRTSRSMLTEVLGRAPRSIAYPFGYHTAAVRAAAAAAGWSLGCEVGYALHRRGGDPLAVRRLLVGPGTTG